MPAQAGIQPSRDEQLDSVFTGMTERQCLTSWFRTRKVQSDSIMKPKFSFFVSFMLVLQWFVIGGAACENY